MDSFTGKVEPLCDVCNRNQYPCRCRLAKDEIIIGCKHFIRAISPGSAACKPDPDMFKINRPENPSAAD